MKPAKTGATISMAAALIAFGLVSFADWSTIAWLPMQVAFAVLLSIAYKQPRWWVVIQLVFMPLVVAALQLNIPPLWYLMLFIMAFAVFGRVDRTRVPLYLSSGPALRALANEIPAGGRVLDLGAGTGTAVAFLSRQGQLCVEGVEHAWLPWLISTTRLRLEGSRGKVIRGDMMAWPLQGYDVVYAFLSPAAMPSLWDKAKREMRSGALLVSNSFEVPGVVADRVIECDPTKGRRLYIWQMP